MRTLVLSLSAAALMLAVAAPAAADPKVEKGAAVYAAQKCAMCHSIEGKGNKKFPLDGVGSKLNDADLKEWIVDPVAAAKKHNSTGSPKMKAYPNLPAADLEGLVAYMKSLKK